MEAFIKYVRINKLVTELELVEVFNDIIKSGNEIISYNEETVKYTEPSGETKFQVTIITGKKQNRIL